MRRNKSFFAALFFVLATGAAQAKVLCEDFKSRINAVLEEEGRTPLEWESARSFNGFNSINPRAGIKAAIECNDAGELIELGASVPFLDDTDRTAEPIFVRAMLMTIDPKMTPKKADELANQARNRLRSISKATGSHRVSVAEYTLVFGKGAALGAGISFRYDLEAKK
jgi:hypothetical protein